MSRITTTAVVTTRANPARSLLLAALGFALLVASVIGVAPKAMASTTVVIPGTAWLQGKGVDVRDDLAYSTTTNPWQCVELPQARLYPKFGWPKVYADGGAAAAYRYGAKYIPEGSPGLTRYNPGSGYLPVPGDLIIENESYDAKGKPVNGYGHVSVVDRVEGNIIHAVQQNRAGRHDYTYNNSKYAGGYGTIKAVLHAPQNTFRNPATAPPAKPTGPRVVSTTGTTAVLAWTDASNNEDGFVSQYRIGTGAWVAGPSAAVNAKSLTVTGLKIGTAYTFQVAAKNAKGTIWSVYFYGTTVALPIQPASPYVKSIAGTSAVLAWKDASNNETQFVSQYRVGTGAWTAGPAVGANATSMTVSGLRPATSYTFQVAARNSAGTKWSVYFSGTTPQILPALPTNPRVTATTGTTATLNWTDTSSNEASFVSQYRIGTGAWIAGPSVGANVTSMTVTGLKPGTGYTFQVGAKNSVGTRWSAYFSGNTVPLPAQPTGVKVKSTTGTTAVLAWTDASNNETGFTSQYRVGSGAWVAGPSVGAGVTSLTVSRLTPGLRYTFQVGARNVAGTNWSGYFYGDTLPLPAQPTGPIVKSTTSTTAVLAWTDASNNESSFVSQYRVGSGAWIAGPSVGAGVTSMTVTGLTPGTSYTFQVGARNAIGTKWSVYFTGNTPQALPAQPTNPRVASTSTTSATLAWGDASSIETGFVVQYRVGTGPWIPGPAVGANSTSAVVSNLIPGVTYTFQVGARNAVGTHWSAYFTGATQVPATYHTGRQITIDSHATGGVSGHDGPGNSYATGPTRPANSALWIVCYVHGQSITGPYGASTIWNLSDDGYYYTDAWLYTGSMGAVVPACAPRTVTVDSHATGGVSGHRGPDNSFATGPTRPVNSGLTIVCYVNGQSITGPYGASTIWNLSDDGYYYTDAWLYTGSMGAVVPHC